MKYNKKEFNSGVRYYRKTIPKKKRVFVLAGLDDEKAYYSIAPLSKAVHDNGGELSIAITDKQSGAVAVLFDTWELYKDMKDGKESEGVKALKDFIAVVEKKAGKGKFEKIFSPPHIIIRAEKNGFYGNIELEYRHKWFRKYKWQKLLETSRVIWDQVYNLKREAVGIGFETIPAELNRPLEDFLDTYPISWAMMAAVRKKVRRISLGASSHKKSMLVPMEKTSDLRTTLLGCELSKDIGEPVFKKFRMLGKHLKTGRLKTNDATFFIAGSRYPGRHLFGEVFGYPSPNRKTRWQSPGQMVYKLDFYPQTKDDSRPPRSRVGFTDTLPIDIFIKTNNIDWLEMKRKDDALRRVADKSRKFIVKTNMKGGSEFVVSLIKKDGTKREGRNSDVEIRNKINPHYLKKTGIKAGTMANLPGGEMFLTPEYVKGKIVGDVVINVDRSYRLSARTPLVVHADEKGYKIKSGPKKIISTIRKRKREAMKQIKEQEKNKSLPKKIIDMKKENFNRIGEFAINTNPKAELCDYLIVNEKIAGMIHIALGSGFDPDRATGYHYDIVINAKRQKLDIYGVDDKDRKIWAMKKGKLAV